MSILWIFFLFIFLKYFKIETKYGETFIDAERFKPLEVGDYVVFKSDSCSEQIIGRICENMEGDYIMTFPCDKSTDYIAYESIQEVYNFWKNTHDEAKWIRVKEKNSLVPEWDCNSKYLRDTIYSVPNFPYY